jgi:hypothetical protein
MGFETFDHSREKKRSFKGGEVTSAANPMLRAQHSQSAVLSEV